MGRWRSAGVRLGSSEGRLEVGGDACAFPVAAGLRVDCFGDGDGRLQVGVHGESLPGMGAAAGALADDGGPAELLQVVAELLAAGERGRAGEYVDRLGLAEAAAGNIRKRPGLLELAA